MSETIKVDIWSDVACPWCYIGKRKFERGAAQFGGDVEVEYHSFELQPDNPVDIPLTSVEYLAQKKGQPIEQVRQRTNMIVEVAKQVGLDFDFDTVKQTNTVKAHQLIHYAKAHGRQDEMKERLLKAFFVDGKHVGKEEELADLAAEIGFDRSDVVRSLASDEYLGDVRADQLLAQEYGIRGVPFFVIDGKYGVSGAQEAETFASVLSQVREEKAAAAAESSATEAVVGQ